MWRAQKSNSFITVVFRTDSISCSVIKSNGEKLHLQTYERAPLHTHELVAGTIYNPTRIKNIIRSFITRNKIKTADLLISIEAHAIFQTLIDLPKATPERADFRIPRLHALVWDYQYLYPKDDGLFSFYVAGIPQSLLAQYKLLFINLPLEPRIITTEMTAQLHLYRYLYGAAFRASQLRHDMQCNDNQLIRYFAPEIMRRMAHIPIDFAVENSYAIASLGLGALGKKLYGD